MQAQMLQKQMIKAQEPVKVDWYSDLYSAGAVFWEMITGEMLEQDPNDLAEFLRKPIPDIRSKLRENNDRLTLDLDMLAERIEKRDASLDQFKMEMLVLQKGLVARLQKVFNKTLDIDPRRRYQDYAELQADLGWIVENHNVYQKGLNQLLKMSAMDFAETAVRRI